MKFIIILLAGLFVVLSTSCVYQPRVLQSEDLIKSSLVGRWSGGGEHWTFSEGGQGHRTTYAYTPHIPFDGSFTWELLDRALLRIQHTNSSDWSEQLAEYEIVDLTETTLTLEPLDGEGDRISVERVD